MNKNSLIEALNLPKNPRKILEECSEQKELRMQQNSSKAVHRCMAGGACCAGLKCMVVQKYMASRAFLQGTFCLQCMAVHNMHGQPCSSSAWLCTYERPHVHNLESLLPCSLASHELLKPPLFLQFVHKIFLSLKTPKISPES